MAGLRRRLAPDAVEVRVSLAVKLRGLRGLDDTADPRLALAPDGRTPRGVYRHPARGWLAALEAGEPVDLPAFYVRRLADFPAHWHRVHIEADGTISPSGHERGWPSAGACGAPD